MPLAASLAATVAFVAAAFTTSFPAEPVVSATWLNQHLHEPGLVILQVGPPSDFAAGHIAGARYAQSLERRAVDPGMEVSMATMPDIADLQRNLQTLGVSPASHVVVVFVQSGVPSGTRAVFTLRYAGVDNVSLLDGGLSAWQRAGLPLSRDTVVAASATGTFATHPEMVAYVHDVEAREHAPHARLVDARAASYFTGAANGEMSAGHVPGAVNIPFNSLFDDNRELLPVAQLAAKFASAGIGPSDTVIAYCHVGMQATVVALAARLTGHPVRLYVGSFHDWSAHKLPTEGGKP